MSANERNTLEVPLVGEKGGARTWAKTVAATEAKNELLTQGDPWIERFKEVSRGRSSEEAR